DGGDAQRVLDELLARQAILVVVGAGCSVVGPRKDLDVLRRQVAHPGQKVGKLHLRIPISLMAELSPNFRECNQYAFPQATSIVAGRPQTAQGCSGRPDDRITRVVAVVRSFTVRSSSSRPHQAVTANPIEVSKKRTMASSESTLTVCASR